MRKKPYIKPKEGDVFYNPKGKKFLRILPCDKYEVVFQVAVIRPGCKNERWALAPLSYLKTLKKVEINSELMKILYAKK